VSVDKRVGFIGLGTMGGPMAANILKGGYPLTVYDVVPAAVDRLVGLGAGAASSPREVGLRSDVVFSSLPDSIDVESVYVGPDGVLDGVAPGAVVIEMSTISPATTARVREAAAAGGVRMLDAPVGKTSEHAVTGTLTIMVGGDRAVLEECEPILRCVGSDIFHCGGPGAGIAMKLVNNLLSTAIMAVDAEALAMGLKAGLAVDKMLEVMGSTAAANAQLTTLATKTLAGDDRPGWSVRLAYKDLSVLLELASQLTYPAPMLAAAHAVYAEAVAQGHGPSDVSALIRPKARIAGVELGSGLNPPFAKNYSGLRHS
jgi:3-hydroxyisobutyrate dehydrogenase-like beta-hydroxyacid dehydrogenase